MIRNVVFVCTGNICRSPMAEAMLSGRLQGSAIHVSSAGIAALVSYPADPFAREVMMEHGYDITAHRAKQARREELIKVDLILTLDQTHTDWLASRFPELLGRVHKLGRWRSNTDVEDPYRRPKEVFQRVFEDISFCVDDWANRLRHPHHG